MPQSLRKFIGVALLVLSVGVTSCQALLSDGRSGTVPPPAVSAPESAGD